MVEVTVTRRLIIKRALRTGAYVAPAVLGVSQVSAAPRVTAPPTMTPLPMATATTAPMSTATTAPPTGNAALMVVQAGTTPSAPLVLTGSGYAAGMTLRIGFYSPSGTNLNNVYALTSATGAFRALFDPSSLPLGTLTFKVTDSNASTYPAPILASTPFTLTNNMSEVFYVQFTTGYTILAGNMATVAGVQLVAGANYTFYVITADGRTAATIAATAVPGFPGSTQGTATVSFPTAGFPLGNVFVAIGPAGSTNLLAFVRGTIA